MTSLAVALAIQIEEAFPGTICYFDRLPDVRAKKPDSLVLIKTSDNGQVSCSAYSRDSAGEANAYTAALQGFLDELALRLDPSRPGQPSVVVRFLPSPTQPACELLEGYIGHIFELHQPLIRKAA